MLLTLAADGGCKGRVSGEPHESNLRLMAVLYSQYVAAHDGDAPGNEEEFKAYVESLGPGVLERAGLSGLDNLFISARDGQPYAIKCLDQEWPLEGVIAYEQTGADGTRLVAAKLGRVSEVTEADFQGRLKSHQ